MISGDITEPLGYRKADIYFSADIETDGPIPGPFSILSIALVYAGSFDGVEFRRPRTYDCTFYREMKPISPNFDPEALRVNGLNRDSLAFCGEQPQEVMTDASRWVRAIAASGRAVLAAYPLSFDWAWLYWYFTQFSEDGSPFDHSRCYDMKTAYAVKACIPISQAGRSNLLPFLRPMRQHTHHALDDAIEQAEIFANIFEWGGVSGHVAR